VSAADDRSALRDLVERYALGVDERQLTAVAELFAADGVLAVPRPPTSMDPVVERVGRESIASAMASLDRYVATLHAVVGHVVDFDPVEPERLATGTVSCLAHHLLRDDEDDTIVALVWSLRYKDAYAVVDGAWRFTRRSLHVDWIEERPIGLARG
jgi:hypothetical protein